MEHDMTVRFPRSAILAVPFSLAAFPAFAHHMMGGRTPSTFMEGLLSGLGHPVIGLDHFAFLVAIGIAVGIFGLNLLLPVAFIVAMAFGVLLHVNGAGLPGAELVVAASVLLAGGLIAWGRPLPVAAWGALFAIAGLFHGYSLGEFDLWRGPLDAGRVPAGPRYHSERPDRRRCVADAPNSTPSSARSPPAWPGP